MTSGTMRQKATSAFVKLGDACPPAIFLVPALHCIVMSSSKVALCYQSRVEQKHTIHSAEQVGRVY